MNIFLWVLQVLSGALFFQHGLLLFNPPKELPERMAERMGYILDLSPRFRRFIGAAEVFGGIGVILPALTGIQTWLTPLAAAGLALIMLSAIVFHLARKEHPNIVFNLVLFGLTGYIAYMRWFVYPF